MARERNEEQRLRGAALKNAESILLARQRAERDLLAAKEVLEKKTQELAGSLALMRATLESTFDGILVTDGAGRITDCNEKFLQMWRVPRQLIDAGDHEALLAASARQLAHPGKFIDRVEEILADAPTESFEVLELADGRVVERYSRTQVVEGRNVGRVWSFRDVTARRHAEDDLRQQREWFQVTLSSIGDAVITTDTRGRVTFLNPIAEAMTGWKSDEAAGFGIETVCNLVNEETRQPVENPIRKVLREGVIITLANHTGLVSKTGIEMAIEDSAAPIRDSAGKVTGGVMVFHDVSVRRRAEQALRDETRVLELLNRTGTAIAAQLDVQALLQTVTDAGTQISGAKFGAFFHKKTGTGGDAFSLYTLSGAPPEAFAKTDQLRITPLFGPTFRGEAPVRIDDVLKDTRYGRMRPHHGMPKGHLPVRSYLAVPVKSRSGEVFGGLFFGHPEPGVFSERAERVLVGVAAQAGIALDNARLYEDAQQEIANRERAEEALRDADRRKDEFVATLAHELRNPLASVLQAALISKGSAGEEERRRWSHDIIIRQVQTMSRLLDDLLDIARVSHGAFEVRKEAADLASVVAAAVETARPVMNAKDHRLTIDLPREPLKFAADPMRIAQVLSNLLTNAAKYTDPKGDIRLSAARSGDRLVLKVTDNGIGISAAAMPEIFVMFSQVHAAEQRSNGGLGIGLALAKRVMELHDGTIEASSPGLGRGSEFTIRLPIGTLPRQSAPAVQQPAAPVTPVPRRVLIADDNRDVVEGLAILLRMDGHEVAAAHDGQEALASFAQFRPDVAVLDIGMPSLNGYEVARKVREISPDLDVTLIAVTGWGQQRDKVRAKEAGFDHHFTKPLDPDLLRALLRG